MKKQFLSIVLTLCMALGMLPPKALAAEPVTFNEPQVTGLTVSCGEESVDLLGNQPTITMPAGSKPVFTVTFDNTELLNKVFVTSTKDGETKYLEATFQNGQYVTDSYFDPSDTNYIPGTIAVTYSKKAVKVDKNGHIDGTDISTLNTQLTAQGVFCRNEITASDGTVTAQIVLGDMFDAMADEYFNAAVSEFMAGASIDKSEFNKWLGVYQNLSQLSSYDLEGADGKRFTLYLGDGKDFGDSDTYLMLVKDTSSNKYTKMLLNKAADKVGLGDISDALSAANVVTKKLLEYRTISEDTAALREEIEAHPTMTQQEKAEANAKITALDHDKKLFLIGMTTISLLTSPVGSPLVMSALVAGYSSIANYFWDWRVGMIRGCAPIDGAFSCDSEHEGFIPLKKEDLASIWGAVSSGVFVVKNSGKYYVPEPIYYSNIGSIDIGDRDGVNPALDVTICMHGSRMSQLTVFNGSTLRIGDCKDINTSNSVSVREKSKLIMNSGILGSISAHNDGKVIINGGKITTDIMGFDESTITINGGEISGQFLYAIDNGSNSLIVNGGEIHGIKNGSGIVTVSGGIITSQSDATCGISNLGGKVNIIGGRINNGIVNKNDAQLMITSGMISGGVTSSSTQPVTLHIDSTTDITVNGTRAFDATPTVIADTGYSGGVIYYNSENAKGTAMTIEEAATIDFTLPYIRLVADAGSSCQHSYTSVVISPTCTERGYTTYTCSKCGDIYQSDYINALGHSYSEWVITTSPTASAAGQRERTCSRCGSKETSTFPNWSYNDASQTVTISGTIPEDEQVLIARYGPSGRFLGLETVTRSKTVNVSGNKEILLVWINKDTYIPVCPAKRIFQ